MKASIAPFDKFKTGSCNIGDGIPREYLPDLL